MRYTITNEILKLEVDSRGAELMSIQTLQDPLEFLWQGDPAYWARRAPILFPIVGALKDNRYTYKGKTYAMGQHGFARDLDFILIEATADSLIWLLQENPQTLQIYPFPFQLYTTYSLKGNSLSIKHKVSNSGRETMWFSIGEHPGFNCPLLPGETLSDYSLVFEQEELLDRTLVKDSLLTEEKEPFLHQERTVPLSPELFKRKAIVLEKFKSDSLTLVSKNHSRKVTVTLAEYPYLGIWSPQTGAPFICIEPWYGRASSEDSDGDITRKPGIIALEAGEDFHCGFKIIID
ncbi:MAG: aldose 1-epimerase family protein [Thermodesulfobacteriota bacterium]